MSVLDRVRGALPGRSTPGDRPPVAPPRGPHLPPDRPVAEARLRELTTVRAEVIATEASPEGATPAFTARLEDGTGTLDLLWLGRRAVGAVVPGVRVRATGRVCDRGGIATIYNPTYELLPARERLPATDRRTTA